MGRGYLNVRATGGAVKSLPWRGQRGLGCRSKPLLKDKKGLGMLVTCRVEPCKKKEDEVVVTPQPWLQKPPPRGHVGLILIKPIPIPRILRLSPRGL